MLCHFRRLEPPAAAEPAAPVASSLNARAASPADNPRPRSSSAKRAEPTEVCGQSDTRQRRGQQHWPELGPEPLVSLWPALLPGRIGRGTQSALISSRVCESSGGHGHAHPQSASVQGSTRAFRESGATRALPRLLGVQQTSPQLRGVGSQSAGSGGVENTEGGTADFPSHCQPGHPGEPRA